MSAALSATDRARFMVLTIGGPRPFGDTKESWCARTARKLALTPRRIRALLSNEKIRLSADEYVRIEALYLGATEALASLSHLASQANVLANSARPRGDARGEDARRPAGEEAQHSASGPAVRGC